ncbi:MAG: TonB family protein [Terracidiphilus sp.]
MSTTAIRADWTGRVLDGRFTLLQWLGASDSGGVFLAELHGLAWNRGDIELVPADAADAEARKVCWELAAALSHPHLIQLIETGRCQLDGVALLYAVTEHSDEVLAQVLLERPLTLNEIGEMLGPVLEALSYLHDYGFVHGHLRPSNIMAVDDRLKLSSNRVLAIGRHAGHSSVAAVYDAPEIANAPVTPAADIWSLGVTLIEVFTQHPVWDKSPQGEPIVPPSIPQPFYTIAQECLRSDPARRCTLNDIKARLQPEPPPPAPVSEVREQEETRKPTPAKRKGPLLIAAVLFLIAFAATFFVWSRHSQSPAATRESEPAIPAPPPESQAASTPAPNSVENKGAVAERVLPEAPPAATRESEPAIPAPPPESSAASNPAPDGVENKGAVAERVLPEVPPSALNTIHGQFKLAILVAVDPQGNVSNAEIDSQGPSRYFANLALQAAQKWKFKAPIVGGKPIESEWILQFRFTREATDVTPVRTSP